MSGHGGARSGAGGPQRGVSQARRLMLRALTRGLEIAGREHGLEGDPEAVATETAAQIAADMIRLGRGDEVLKLYVLASPANDGQGEGSGKGSVLLDALSKLPGMDDPVPELSSDATTEDGFPVNSTGYEGEATDGSSVAGSNGLMFHPQNPLFGPAGLALAGARQAGGRATPHTPPAPSR